MAKPGLQQTYISIELKRNFPGSSIVENKETGEVHVRIYKIPDNEEREDFIRARRHLLEAQYGDDYTIIFRSDHESGQMFILRPRNKARRCLTIFSVGIILLIVIIYAAVFIVGYLAKLNKWHPLQFCTDDDKNVEYCIPTASNYLSKWI